MLANDIFFGRGSIQLSHNFNYIKASTSMTGHPESFCSQPEMLALSETYSWAVGMYLWMDLMSKEGLTSHVSVLRDADFGGALNIINGGNECPVAEDDSFFSKAIVNRIDHYCNVAKLLGSKLLGLNGCKGLDDVFSSCAADGSCPRCAEYQAGQIFDHNSYAETSTTDATIAAEIIDASDRPQRTSIPTNLPIKRPTRAPITPKPSHNSRSKAPTVLPTSSPTKDDNNIAESDVSSEAAAFASNGVTISSHDEKYNKPGQNTQADTFAVTSHSEESNSVDSLPLRTKSPVSSSPTLNPTTPSPLSNPPTQSVEAKLSDWSLTSVIDTAFTDPPTEEPIDTTINVQDITFRPPYKSELSEEATQQNEQEFDPELSSGESSKTRPTTTQFPMDSIMEMSASEELTETQSTTTQTPIDSIVEMSAFEESTHAHVTSTHSPSFSTEIVKTSESLDPTQTGNHVTTEESYSMEQAESVPKQEKEESTGIIFGRISHATEGGENIGLRAILVDLFECFTDVWISGETAIE